MKINKSIKIIYLKVKSLGKRFLATRFVFDIDKFKLNESELKRMGPFYTLIEEFSSK